MQPWEELPLMMTEHVRREYKASVTLARLTGQWHSVSPDGPGMWTLIAYRVDAVGRMQQRLTAAGLVEDWVLTLAATANWESVRAAAARIAPASLLPAPAGPPAIPHQGSTVPPVMLLPIHPGQMRRKERVEALLARARSLVKRSRALGKFCDEARLRAEAVTLRISGALERYMTGVMSTRHRRLGTERWGHYRRLNTVWRGHFG